MDTAFLNSIGWTESLQTAFDVLNAQRPLRVGRVIGQSKGHYQILIGPEQTLKAEVSGKFHKSASEATVFPTVGDWVGMSHGSGPFDASIEHVLPRRTLIQRKRSGRRSEEMQLIAANVDYVLIVSSVNEDFDLPRIGRYLSLTTQSGCVPVIVLTKTDLITDAADFVAKTTAQFGEVEVCAISQREPESLEPLAKFFAAGRTTVLVGSSGVGKSTLTNYLLGFEAQRTQGLSSASRGKHTTTTRDLRVTRFGGLVIDTPGMQEIAEQTDEDQVSTTFADVAELELQCKFSDCQHGKAPGCAITRAIKAGELTEDRLEAFLTAKRAAAPRGRKKSRR